MIRLYLLLFLSCVPVAHANDSDRISAARNVISAADIKNNILQMAGGLGAGGQVDLMVKRMAPLMKWDSGEQQKISVCLSSDPLRASLQKTIEKIDFTDALEQMSVLYAKAFTKSELDWLAKFYRSEFGKKFLKKTPILAQQSNLVIMQLLADNKAIMDEQKKTSKALTDKCFPDRKK